MSTIVQLSPVKTLPIPKMEDLNVEWVDDTTLKVKAGRCWDATGTFGIILDEDITLYADRTGANALDTGTLAADKIYAVFVIASQGNRKIPATIFSLDYENPYLPADYDLCRRVGFWRTDGSVHFLKGRQVGNGARKLFKYDALINLLTDGAATSFTAVDVSAAFPAVEGLEIGLKLSYTPNTASNDAYLIPYGGEEVETTGISGVVAAQTQVAQINHIPISLDSGVPKIEYKVTESTDTLTIDADYYIDNL